MNILPTLADVREIASDGAYKVIPVSCEILSDFITPVEAIKILKNRLQKNTRRLVQNVSRCLRNRNGFLEAMNT